MRRALVEKITNRYTILLANILASGIIVLILYGVLLLYTKASPLKTLGAFFDIINVVLKIVGVLIFIYTAVIGVAFINAMKKGKREHIWGYLFTLVYCLSLTVLYWLY